MRLKQWLIVLALLAPGYVPFGVWLYWTFFDNEPPMTLVYQYPHFLREEAANRAEAESASVHAVGSGQRVFIYREICTRGEHDGTLRAQWESGSFVWSAAERTFITPPRGCYTRNLQINAPTTNPTRTFVYTSYWMFELNPLKSVSVFAPPLELRVMAPNEEEEHKP